MQTKIKTTKICQIKANKPKARFTLPLRHLARKWIGSVRQLLGHAQCCWLSGATVKMYSLKLK